MMSLETEQKLIEHLYECVNVHPHREELIKLMYDQSKDLDIQYNPEHSLLDNP